LDIGPRSRVSPTLGWKNASFGETRLRVPGEFRPTRKQFCPTPGAKFSQFRPTATLQPTTSKRFARAWRGETRRISPHQKKKKYEWGENPPNEPLASAGQRSTPPRRATSVGLDTARRCAKLPGGVLRTFEGNSRINEWPLRDHPRVGPELAVWGLLCENRRFRLPARKIVAVKWFHEAKLPQDFRRDP
jgi:hypothetical protein